MLKVGMGGEIISVPLCLYGMRVDTYIYLFLAFQNPYKVFVQWI
jgi:hypothetical protein